jgi:hypothetical protein
LQGVSKNEMPIGMGISLLKKMPYKHERKVKYLSLHYKI